MPAPTIGFTKNEIKIAGAAWIRFDINTSNAANRVVVFSISGTGVGTPSLSPAPAWSSPVTTQGAYTVRQFVYTDNQLPAGGGVFQIQVTASTAAAGIQTGIELIGAKQSAPAITAEVTSASIKPLTVTLTGAPATAILVDCMYYQTGGSTPTPGAGQTNFGHNIDGASGATHYNSWKAASGGLTMDWTKSGGPVAGAQRALVIEEVVVGTTTEGAGESQGGSSAQAAGAISVPPANTAAPTIDDTTPEVGQLLTGNPGTWTGEPAPDLAYQWFRELIITAPTPDVDYRFDDGAGQQLTDYGPGAHHGVLGTTSGVDSTDQNWTATGLLFERINGDLVNCPAAFQTAGSFTIEVVFQAVTGTLLVSYAGLIMLGAGASVNSAALQMFRNNNLNTMLFRTGNPTGTGYSEAAGAASVYEGGWHHLHVEVDVAGNVLSSWVDGALDVNAAAMPNIGYPGSSVLRIGHRELNQYHNGTIGLVRLYHKLLDADERAEARNAAVAIMAARGVTLP